MDDTTVDWVWCIHAETGQEVLMDRKTNKVITTMEFLRSHDGHKPETKEA